MARHLIPLLLSVLLVPETTAFRKAFDDAQVNVVTDDVKTELAETVEVEETVVAGWVYIGEGGCRTASGGGGTSTVVSKQSVNACRAECDSETSCVAVEFNPPNGRCELHTESIATSTGAGSPRCWIKHQVDFSGHYILDRVEGEPDHAAYNAGVSWAQRQAAYVASYGAGTLRVDLTHRDDHFDIRSSTPLGHSRVQFDVGGGRQTATASDGGHFDIEPVWDGNEVRATMYRGNHVTHIRRYMRGDNMIIESTIDGYYHNAMTREIYKPRD